MIWPPCSAEAENEMELAMKYIGIEVTSTHINYVVIESEYEKSAHVIEDTGLKVPKTQIPHNYQTVFTQIQNLIENNRDCIIGIGASQTSGVSGLSHLKSAELRGVVTVAAGLTGVLVKHLSPTSEAKRDKKAGFDNIKSDEDYWSKILDRDITKERRKAAYIAIKMMESENE